MNKLNFFKDKGGNFKCQVLIEGANIDESFARLCLEFDNNINLYFNGKIAKDGMVSIPIPALKFIDSSNGKATVEVVAEGTYFQAYERQFEVTTKLSVKVNEIEQNDDFVIENKKPKVQFVPLNEDDSDDYINENKYESKKNHIVEILEPKKTFKPTFKSFIR